MLHCICHRTHSYIVVYCICHVYWHAFQLYNVIFCAAIIQATNSHIHNWTNDEHHRTQQQPSQLAIKLRWVFGRSFYLAFFHFNFCHLFTFFNFIGNFPLVHLSSQSSYHIMPFVGNRMYYCYCYFAETNRN